MKAQEIINECEYYYWKVVCNDCDNIIAITNHKKKYKDILFAGDAIPTKHYKGILKDGEIIRCMCNSTLISMDTITYKEYKKIKRDLT